MLTGNGTKRGRGGADPRLEHCFAVAEARAGRIGYVGVGTRRLFLTLRRPDDDIEITTDDGETVRSLLGQSGESANGRDNAEFVDWLHGVTGRQPSAADPLAEVAVPEGSTPKWKMVILGSNGSREFLWNDEKDLPTETAAVASGNETDAASSFAPSPLSRSQPAVPRAPQIGDKSARNPTPVEDLDTEEDIPVIPQ